MKDDKEYFIELKEILSKTTYRGWAKRIPAQHIELCVWIKNKTAIYNPVNFMESIYIVEKEIIPPVCLYGNKCRFVSYSIGYQRTCSRKCKCFSKLSRDITIKNQANYSDEKWKEINDKVTSTCIKKYSSARSTSIESSIYKEVRTKSISTNIERYNTISYNGSNAQRSASLEKYGTDYPVQAEIIKHKIRNTCNERYGVDSPLKSKEIRNKIDQTNLERYKVINPIYNIELKQRAYDSQVASGKYTDPKLKDDWIIYQDISHFKGSIDNFIHTDEQWKLYKKYGLFNSRSKNMNLNGLVRDHKFSRRHGFDYRVFPEIIRHPVNCILIPHRNNSGKGYASSISLNELFDSIFCYQKEWHEHQICIKLIDKYLEGERWVRLFVEKE